MGVGEVRWREVVKGEVGEAGKTCVVLESDAGTDVVPYASSLRRRQERLALEEEGVITVVQKSLSKVHAKWLDEQSGE